MKTATLMPRVIIDHRTVEDALTKLNPDKSAGPDEVHPAMVKALAAVIRKPISKLFQASVDQGYVPEDWRSATVVAIHKKAPGRICGTTGL